jgi:hypothetical protein
VLKIQVLSWDRHKDVMLKIQVLSWDRHKDVTLKIQVLSWDRHKDVAGLTLLMGSQPFSLNNWISNNKLYIDK